MAGELCAVQHPIAQRGQVGAGLGDGALEPAIAGAVAGRKGEKLYIFILGRQHGRQLRFPPSGHLGANARFVALVGRLVKDLALERRGQILLGHPVIAIGVGIEIALPVAKAFLVPVGVAQVIGHATVTFRLDHAQRIEQGKGRVGFRRGGQVEGRLG